jgi:hypothetical protein
MVATMLSLVATAVLVALLLSTTLHSSDNSTTSITNAPGVAEADGLQAQQALSTGLTAAETAAAGSGGFGQVTAAMLTAANPSTTFTSGPSTSAAMVSVATSTDSITLADRASDGTCWLVWNSSTGGTWFGAQTGLPSCTAPVLASAPVASPVSSSSIGWQEGSFPTT